MRNPIKSSFPQDLSWRSSGPSRAGWACPRRQSGAGAGVASVLTRPGSATTCRYLFRNVPHTSSRRVARYRQNAKSSVKCTTPQPSLLAYIRRFLFTLVPVRPLFLKPYPFIVTFQEEPISAVQYPISGIK
ncbi:hypothetical protein BDY19DRAFT_224071 [Irpex rosettiformis]|uniref:Uncharacterized protein n=1 Tax=Irpex rosettiformis TaxID=378272 RepID=A0ACB8U0R6_9APHY|nr:hypothetical protein BDY19DRAFT_224071 [Irpex rosettiformis]